MGDQHDGVLPLSGKSNRHTSNGSLTDQGCTRRCPSELRRAGPLCPGTTRDKTDARILRKTGPKTKANRRIAPLNEMTDMKTSTAHRSSTGIEHAWKPILIATFLAICATATPALAGAGNQGNPGIIPPHAKFRGLSYGEWGAMWWTTAFSIPVVNDDHPLFSGGTFGGHKGVMFLAGVGGGPPIEVTIAPGTALFFPVINAECSVLEPDPFHGDDEASLRACANGHIDNTSGLFAVIDGVPANNLASYRVESPLFEFGPLPEDNLFDYFGLDAPAGTTSASVDAGVYLLLAPLSVGTHSIHFGGTFDLLGFSIDTTYVITVAP